MAQDFDWVTKETETFLKSGYLSEGESVKQRVKDISQHAEDILGIEGFADKFFDYMSRGWISLSSPVWSNYGKNRGLPVSCFSTYVKDDVGGILYSQSEVGMQSKVGGGTSGYFGDIRPRGSSISDNGKTGGSVHFMELFEKVADVISQGSTRRGRFSPYLPIEHGDIDEFLDVGTEGHPIQNLTTAVTVTDDFMNSIINGDKENRKTWAKLLKTRSEIGFPYIMFSGNANRNKPDVYKDNDMEILNSQLCISGNDRVVTDRGYLTARELYEQGGELVLFNGHETVKASEMKLRDKSADVYKITLENGLEQTVTGYHGIPLLGDRNETTRVEAKDVKIGDKVAIQTEKGIFGNRSMKNEAFLLGLYQSDGTQNKDNIMLDVWENDFDILEEVQEKFNIIHNQYGCDRYDVANQYGTIGSRSRLPATFHECNTLHSKVRKQRLSSKTLKKALNFEKGYVPDWIWESDEETIWEYVRGLLIADGTVRVGSDDAASPVQVAYADINREFLKELQLILNNLGLRSSVRILKKSGESLLPDGKGGHKLYQTKDCYRLIVSDKPSALEIEKNTGFLSRKNVSIEEREYRDNRKKGYLVEKIEYVGKEEVFCPTVKNDEHIFVSQGMKTFNCSEIMLPQNEKESFVCVLSSVNLLKYDEWKDSDLVETMIYFLDSVCSEFLTRMDGYRDSSEEDDQIMFYFMKRTYEFTKRHRALGLGVLGWHSLLQSKMIPFESSQASELNREVHSLIEQKSNKASRELADMFGEPELLKGYGRRNTTLNAIAPTTSSAFILGQVSQSIEPLMSNFYIKDLAKLKAVVKNKYLEELLCEKGKNTEEVWDSIASRDGSVQHLGFLTDKEKDVFKTFREIDPKVIVSQAAERQEFLDQTQSLNLMIDNSYSPKDINNLVIDAWKSGVCTLYYQHSVNAAREFTRGQSDSDCTACEA